MIRKVACGISGGVDSAVAAYLMKRKKYDVIGVFMTNWDSKDETGFCSVDQDREDAKYVCDKLSIKFHDVNFTKDYWNNVFENTLNSYQKGLTPNPDILCNKEIKFKRFAEYCLDKLQVDAIATGHYARSSLREDLRTDIPALLMRPHDLVKDQTFWLSQMDHHMLRNCIFPLAELTKTEVKAIAKEISLHRTLNRKESMGMCFIGKRKFKEFIDSYLEPKEGIFRLLGTGDVIGTHKGIHHFTLGQRTGCAVKDKAAFVAKMDPKNQEITVVLDTNHPALFMRQLTTSPPHWLTAYDDWPVIGRGPTRLRMQYQNKYVSIPCSVWPNHDADPSRGLSIRLDTWFRCVAPGQYAVLYSQDDRVCLGSARINTSVSAWEENLPGPEHWDSRDFENQYLLTGN